MSKTLNEHNHKRKQQKTKLEPLTLPSVYTINSWPNVVRECIITDITIKLALKYYVINIRITLIGFKFLNCKKAL